MLGMLKKEKMEAPGIQKSHGKRNPNQTTPKNSIKNQFVHEIEQ
jgi:hypothetical protein